MNEENENETTSLTQVFGRKLPQSEDVEMALLGAAMLEPEDLNEVIDMLTPEAFYIDAHQIIYKAIKKLFIKG